MSLSFLGCNCHMTWVIGLPLSLYQYFLYWRRIFLLFCERSSSFSMSYCHCKSNQMLCYDIWGSSQILTPPVFRCASISWFQVVRKSVMFFGLRIYGSFRVIYLHLLFYCWFCWCTFEILNQPCDFIGNAGDVLQLFGLPAPVEKPTAWETGRILKVGLESF